jgi:DNA polymerase III subunit epsilon
VPALHETPFVVLDFETTGGSPLFDRVIEVAALRVERGQVQDRLISLAAPEVPIPSFVSRLTGISSALVRGMPSFDALVPELRRYLEGAVVVAHNASFDTAFLAQALTRTQTAWAGEKLCTLRLARRLMPGLHSYRLDSLCATLDLPYVQTHRAGPDAEATCWLLRHLLELAAARGIETLAGLLRLQQQPVRRRRLRGKIDEAQVANLPTGPGVYLLKDSAGHVLYVGKSVNVRKRVRQHLQPSGTARGRGQPRLRRRLKNIADVQAIETPSEIEALLLESKLVKRYLPEANSLLRDYQDYPWLKLDLRERHPRLVATRERPSDGATYFGPFRRAPAVASAAAFLSEQLGLRQCSGALRPGRQSACALLDMGRCLGPCVGRVSETEYRAAAMQAQRVLSGEDTTLLGEVAERRDKLAEELRFEEAAELRDRIRDLEQVVNVQQRLATFANRNVVVVVPDTRPEAARLLLVRAGRLVDQVSLPVAATPSHLRQVLKRAYAEDRSHAAQVSRDELDDLLILDSWLRRNAETAQEVPVSLAAPAEAAPTLRAAIRQLPQRHTAAV